MSNETTTRAEAAAYLGVPVLFLQDAARRGDGPPFFRFSLRTVRYRKSDLDAFRDARIVEPAGRP